MSNVVEELQENEKVEEKSIEKKVFDLELSEGINDVGRFLIPLRVLRKFIFLRDTIANNDFEIKPNFLEAVRKDLDVAFLENEKARNPIIFVVTFCFSGASAIALNFFGQNASDIIDSIKQMFSR